MSALGGGRSPEQRPALPSPPTRIIGRERDVATLCRMILEDGVRVLSLTGPGGVGKTRLALEVAHMVADRFADGVWWLDLASLHEVEQVCAAITTTLRLETDGGPALAGMVTDLRNWHALLVLDNVEQIPGIAEPVAELAAGFPGLFFLMTGRSPLLVRAEQRYPVAPLAVTPPGSEPTGDIRRSLPAVELFAERARSVAPEFALSDESVSVVTEICARLDGLPLAIELVAAQAHTLSPVEMLAQVSQHLNGAAEGSRDLPARQRSLDRTVAWSHDLLPTDLQWAFRRLAVFAGGFSLETATALLADRETHVIDAPAAVAALVVQSLLVREEGVSGESRFRMLGTTRAHALQRLASDDDAEVVRRHHACCFMSLVQRAEAEGEGPDASTWMDRLEADHDNIRAALTWMLDTGEYVLAARLATSLGRFWYVRGHLREGRAWLERILAGLGAGSTKEHVDVLNALGALAGVRGDAHDAARRADAALTLARELGDIPGIAKALHRRGNVARGRGDIVEAARHYEEALLLFRQLDDETGSAAVLNNLGIVAAHMGDALAAREMLEAAHHIYRSTGNQRGIAITLCNLGQRIGEAGSNDASIEYYRDALSLFRSVGDTSGIAWVLQALAELAAEEGIATLAAQLYGAVEAHRASIAWSFSALERSEYDRHMITLREHMGEQAYQRALMDGHSLTDEQVEVTVIPEIVAHITTAREGSALAPSRAGLSQREVQVLQLVAEGLTNGEIAHRLSLSRHTVDTHLRRIYRKLEVRSRSAASRLAVEHELI